MERDDTADAVEILRRRAAQLRPLHEEYLRVQRALAALSPPAGGAISTPGEVSALVMSVIEPGEVVDQVLVRSRLGARGEVVDAVQAANSLRYLASSGRLRRVDRGRYRLEQEGSR